MRTALLIVLGVILAALALWLSGVSRRWLGVAGFGLVWLGVVGWNLRTGLAHGYTLAEEWPIQLLIFSVPLGLAIAWAGSRGG